MKVLVVGASGLIGKAVVQELQNDHEVLQASHQRSKLSVDIRDEHSVRKLFESVGKVDAIIATAGRVHFGPLQTLSAEDFQLGLQDKLLGQVRLALIGQHYLNEGGSITLTTGIISDEPIRDGVNATAVNAGLEGFVRAAAGELPGRRINVVSPTVLTEALEHYGSSFPGFESVPAMKVAAAYRRSVEGIQTGRVYRVGWVRDAG